MSPAVPSGRCAPPGGVVPKAWAGSNEDEALASRQADESGRTQVLGQLAAAHCSVAGSYRRWREKSLLPVEGGDAVVQRKVAVGMDGLAVSVMGSVLGPPCPRGNNCSQTRSSERRRR